MVSILERFRSEESADQQAKVIAIQAMAVRLQDGEEVSSEEIRDRLEDSNWSTQDLDNELEEIASRRAWAAQIKMVADTPAPKVDLADLQAEFNALAKQIIDVPIDDAEAFRSACRTVQKAGEDLTWRGERALEISRHRERLIAEERARIELLAEACRRKLVATEADAAEPTPPEIREKRYWVSQSHRQARALIVANPTCLEPLHLVLADVPWDLEQQQSVTETTSPETIRWKSPKDAEPKPAPQPAEPKPPTFALRGSQPKRGDLEAIEAGRAARAMTPDALV